MIHFMLDAYRQQAVGVQIEGLAVAIERTHGDALGALDPVENARHRQAAFLAFLAARLGDDFRIDEDAQRIVGFGNVDDDDALRTLTWVAASPIPGSVHGLAMSSPVADARINRNNRLGDGVQASIGIMQNIGSGHKKVYE
jgi:hypothetical protein